MKTESALYFLFYFKFIYSLIKCYFSNVLLLRENGNWKHFVACLNLIFKLVSPSKLII